MMGPVGRLCYVTIRTIRTLGKRGRIVALTNAERQKRQRQRVKAALAAARQPTPEELISAMLGEVRDQYLAGARARAETCQNDPAVSRSAEIALQTCARRAFLSWQDVLRLVADAGEQDWTGHFEREMFKWRRAQPS